MARSWERPTTSRFAHLRAAVSGEGPPSLRVALVSMPFVTTRRPSIQLGLLQAILGQRGIQAKSHHLNLHFAARIGWATYEAICNLPRLTGEWIFARTAFGEHVPYSRGLPPDLRDDASPFNGFPEILERIREDEAPTFVEECLHSIPWAEYDVVGFSSMFDQNAAALALAGRIKETLPHMLIVFGGANFEDKMGLEYVRAFDWIDFAVVGEGDRAFPELLERLATGLDLAEVKGIAYMQDGVVHYTGLAPLIRDLDALPIPDYGDFFATAAELELPMKLDDSQRSTFRVSYESARGCWWGAKHHCTFCGLNGTTLAFRSKSPDRVLDGSPHWRRAMGGISLRPSTTSSTCNTSSSCLAHWRNSSERGGSSTRSKRISNGSS